ncbi:MAG: sulfur carrier protein ThiS [Deltaproteobacteria bacterium]|nr:sulfur carrier protein ThiS [Deltaproteobacteria bacterium]
MEIIINGNLKEVREGTTIKSLLEEMKTPAMGIAVELNREIIPRSSHESTVLKAGDALEVVKMVGGG